MEERRLFLQSLVQLDVPSQPATSEGERRRYISVLGGEVRQQAVSEENHPTVVRLSLDDLREFKGQLKTLGAFKQERPPPRKRPNYDNSRRAMHANPEFRIKYLVRFMLTTSYLRSFRSYSYLVLVDGSCLWLECFLLLVFGSFHNVWFLSCFVMFCVEPRQSDNGKDPVRISNLFLRQQCCCHRSTSCFAKLSNKKDAVLSFAETFWSMEKPAQDSYAITPGFKWHC